MPFSFFHKITNCALISGQSSFRPEMGHTFLSSKLERVYVRNEFNDL